VGCNSHTSAGAICGNHCPIGCPREMFRRTTFPQRVVHNHLWIAVDMWRSHILGTCVGTVGLSCRAAEVERGKTRPNSCLELVRVRSYVSNRKPDVPTSKYLVRGSAGLTDEGSSGFHLSSSCAIPLRVRA
jgi:hypothetical protein